MCELNSDFDTYSGPAALWRLPPYCRGNCGDCIRGSMPGERFGGPIRCCSAGGWPTDRRECDGTVRSSRWSGVGMDDSGMVIDCGIDKLCAEQGLATVIALCLDGRSTVALALLPTDVTAPAAVGDVAELRHVDMDHRSGMAVFVATHDLAGAFIDIAQPVQPAADQHRVHC